MGEESNLPPYTRRRVDKACDKCHKLKTKCNGRRPECSRCAAYGYKCSYSDRTGEFSRKRSVESYQLQQTLVDYRKLMEGLVPKLDEEDRARVLKTLNDDDPTSEPMGFRSTSSIYAEHLDTPINDASSSQDATSVFPSACETPSSSDSSTTFLGSGSDISFIRKVMSKLQKCRFSPRQADNELLLSYNLDDHHITPGTRPLPSLVPPPEPHAKALVDIYFSTVHIAYPFIPRHTFDTLFSRLWDAEASETVSASWKATIYVVFAWGAAYKSLADEKGPEIPEHVLYYNQARTYLGDLIDISPPGLDLISSLLLMSLYLLMTHKPYRCANLLAMTIRMAHGIGLHDASQEINLAPADRQRRRLVWYSLYILDRLVALQLGTAIMIRDLEFSVELPSEAGFQEGEYYSPTSSLLMTPSEISYIRQTAGLSAIIGDAIQRLYRPGQNVNDLNKLLETIGSLDLELCTWRDMLPSHLRFDHAHPFETSHVFRRQRNFLAIKFHHLRTLIHRPCLCWPALHSDDSFVLTDDWRDRWDHDLSQRAEATCIAEARQTIKMLDRAVTKQGLLSDFPWWQMISCLMCAQSVIMITMLFSPQHPDFPGLQADANTGKKVMEVLSTQSASAERCVKMINVMRSALSSEKIGVSNDLSSSIRPNDPLFDLFVDSAPYSEIPSSNTENETGFIRHWWFQNPPTNPEINIQPPSTSHSSNGLG